MKVNFRIENHQPVPLASLRSVMRDSDVFFIGTLVSKYGKETEARECNSWHRWANSGDGSQVIELFPGWDDWTLLDDYYDLDASTGRALQPGERVVVELSN